MNPTGKYVLYIVGSALQLKYSQHSVDEAREECTEPWQPTFPDSIAANMTATNRKIWGKIHLYSAVYAALAAVCVTDRGARSE